MIGFPVKSATPFPSQSLLGFWGIGTALGQATDCKCLTEFVIPAFDPNCDLNIELVPPPETASCNPNFTFNLSQLNYLHVPLVCVSPSGDELGYCIQWILQNDLWPYGSPVPDVVGFADIDIALNDCPDSEVWRATAHVMVYGYCKSDGLWTWSLWIAFNSNQADNTCWEGGAPGPYQFCEWGASFQNVNDCDLSPYATATTCASIYLGYWDQDASTPKIGCSAGCTHPASGTYHYHNANVPQLCGACDSTPGDPEDPDGPLFRDAYSLMVCSFGITISGITAFAGLNGRWLINNVLLKKHYNAYHLCPWEFGGNSYLLVYLSRPGGMASTDAVADNLMAYPSPDTVARGSDYQCEYDADGVAMAPMGVGEWTLGIVRVTRGSAWGEWDDYLVAWKRSDILTPETAERVVIAQAPEMPPENDFFAWYPYGGPWRVSNSGAFNSTIIQSGEYTVEGDIVTLL